MMKVIGLTGGIACGKSNVSESLRALGARIIDGDVLSRELTAPNGPALPAIREAFGSDVFLPDGQLNRAALGQVVFSDPARLEALNRIMRPMLRELIQRELSAAEETGAPLCVLEMPLLYEEGLDSLCSRVWCVYIPEDMQLRRLMERNGLTAQSARARMASQMPAAEKARRADVVIDTSGSIEETKAKIPSLYEQELLTN